MKQIKIDENDNAYEYFAKSIFPFFCFFPHNFANSTWLLMINSPASKFRQQIKWSNRGSHTYSLNKVIFEIFRKLFRIKLPCQLSSGQYSKPWLRVVLDDCCSRIYQNQVWIRVQINLRLEIVHPPSLSFPDCAFQASCRQPEPWLAVSFEDSFGTDHKVGLVDAVDSHHRWTVERVGEVRDRIGFQDGHGYRWSNDSPSLDFQT